MKQTSLNAYYEIKNDGTLTKLQQKVYEAIKHYGPLTGRQLDKMVKGGWKRLSELCTIGVIDIMPDRAYDPETKKMVNLYCVTGQMPLTKNPSKRRPSYKSLQLLVEKCKNGSDASKLYAKAYEQGYKDAKAGYDMPEEL